MLDAPVPIPDRGAERPRLRSPNCGMVHYPPGATLGPRVQADYQLVLVHAGAARVTVDGAEREIPAGHIGLLLPGRMEFFAFARERETRHSWIAVAPQQLDGAVAAALDGAVPLLPLSAAMQTCVELARQAMTVDDPGSQPVLTALGRAALALYLAEARHIGSGRAAEHPAVARARQIARQRAHEGLGVRELAQEVGLSAEHLVRLLHRHMGVTPGALLREERLSHALHLLAQTGLSVAEVARQSGFASPHHFARCVKAATGMTPTEVRARTWAT